MFTPTPEMTQILSSTAHHLRVDAGAGVGKTTLMANLVAGRVADGTPAASVLVLMFNVSARDRFRAVLDDIDGSVAAVKVRTLHGFGQALLSMAADMGLCSPLEVLTDDEPELEQFAYAALESANQSLRCIRADQTLSRQVLGEFLNFYARARAEYGFSCSGERLATLTGATPLYRAAFVPFARYLRAAGRFVFAEMIALPLHILSSNRGFAKRALGSYRLVVIDEAQDLSAVDHQLLAIFEQQGARLVTIGDDMQCINGFRGARPDLFRSLPERFPTMSTYPLSRSFRFGESFAAKMASSMSWPEMRGRLDRQTSLNIAFEGAFDKEHALCQQSAQYGSDVMVLIREAAALPVTELTCIRNELPYQLVGQQPFSSQRLAGMIFGYAMMTMASSFGDLPYQLQITTIHNLLYTPYLQMPSSQAAELLSTLPLLAFDQLRQSTAVGERGQPVLLPCRLRLVAAKFRPEHSLESLLRELIAWQEMSSLFNSYRGRNRYSALSVVGLLEYAQRSGITIAQYVAASVASHLNAQRSSPASNAMRIMTVHAAKGTEAHSVIVAQLWDGVFPLIRGGMFDTPLTDLAEERRIFYVATTRARHSLTLLAPHDPLLLTNLKAGVVPTQMEYRTSRFVVELLAAHVSASRPQQLAMAS